MNSCNEYVDKYKYLVKMIRIYDQNFKINLSNHTISMMFIIKKSKYVNELNELKKSDLYKICIE